MASPDIKQAIDDLREAENLLRKMEELAGPENVEKGKKWILGEGLDKQIPSIVALRYNGEARKKDRQKIVPLAVAMQILAELEDNLVSVSIIGPQGQIKKSVRAATYGKYLTYVNIAKGVWNVAKLAWEKLTTDGIKAAWLAVTEGWDGLLELLLKSLLIYSAVQIKAQAESALKNVAATTTLARQAALPQPPAKRVFRKTRHRTG